MSRTTGMLLGKFLPPHLGHQYLFDFARHYVDNLGILVCSLDREPIPGTLRYQWVKEMAPGAGVFHVTEDLPQAPEDSPDFWPIWRRVLRDHFPQGVDYVFASESYGEKVAECLEARFVPVDIGRELRAVSGTAVRNDPLAHWDLLPACVRPYYLRRVCIFGPESTGKSTLARDLARHFMTVHVHEYARPYLDPKGGKCDADDIPFIVRGQAAAEEAMARQANRVLFCDTDNLTTTIWSDIYFDGCADWIMAQARTRKYDLTLLLDIDVPWIDDAQRDLGHRREEFLHRCRECLDEAERPYVLLSGSWLERFSKAVLHVEALLHKSSATIGARFS